jgi:hypothetical protein
VQVAKVVAPLLAPKWAVLDTGTLGTPAEDTLELFA